MGFDRPWYISGGVGASRVDQGLVVEQGCSLDGIDPGLSLY